VLVSINSRTVAMEVGTS